MTPLQRHRLYAESRNLRLQRGSEYLHDLGPRPIGEFLVEIGERYGIGEAILDLLDVYRESLTPEVLRAIGADRWPSPFAVFDGGRQ